MKKPISQKNIKKTEEKLEDKLSKPVKEIDKDGEIKKGGFKLSGISLKTTGAQNSWRDKTKGFKEGKEVKLEEIKQFFEGDVKVVELESDEGEIWGGSLEESVASEQSNFFSGVNNDHKYKSNEDGSRDFYRSSGDSQKDFYSTKGSFDDLYKNGKTLEDEETITEVRSLYDGPQRNFIDPSDGVRSLNSSRLEIPGLESSFDQRNAYLTRDKKDHKYE